MSERKKQRKMSPQMRQHCCFSGCTGAVVILGGLAILLFSEPSKPTRLNVTPEQRIEIRKNAEVKRKDLLNLNKDIKRGVARDFKLEMTDMELTELMSTDPDVRRMMQKYNMRDPWVQIENDKVSLTATGSVGGADVTSTVDFQPRLFGELVDVQVTASRAGNLPMPGMVTERFAGRIASKIKDKIAQEGLRVKRLQVTSGRIVVEGTTSKRPGSTSPPIPGG
jgi:hypothetical protein